METLMRRAIQVGVLAGLLLAVGVVAWAHGGDRDKIHACVQRESGRVRIVGSQEHCRPWERHLDWSRGGQPGPSSAAFFEVVDAAGTVVGPVVGVNSLMPVVGFKLNGVAFVLGVSGDAFFGFDFVYFASGDCSGTAYLRRSGAPLATAAVDRDGRVVVDDGLSAPAPTQVGSFAVRGSCFPTDDSPDLVPGTLVFDVGAFQAPFRAR